MVVSKLNVLMEEYVKITMMDLVNVFVPRDFSANFVKTVSHFPLSHLKRIIRGRFYRLLVQLQKYINFIIR